MDEDKMVKLLKRIENYIEVTNPKILLGDGSNIRALMSLYTSYSYTKMGGPHFWHKLEQLLEEEIKSRKKFKLDTDDLIPIINALAQQRNVNEHIWAPLLADLDKAIQVGSVNNLQIFYLMRALQTVGLLQEDLTK